MFDPDTKVCEFWGIRIYHHDPCKDGTDDSCGWSRPKLTKKEIEYSECLIDNEHDNLRGFFGEQQVIMVGDKAFFENVSRDDAKRYIRIIARNFKRLNRKWYQHPRWHFWHWHIHVRWLRLRFGKKLDNTSTMQKIDW